MADYDLETIKDALDYYQETLEPLQNNNEKTKFYFIKSDLNDEIAKARNLKGILESQDPELDINIPKYKEIICSSLECYKQGIEKITDELKEELKTKPSFVKTKEKIETIDKMIEKICNGKFHVPEGRGY
ncbi:MAG: hypothetical protein GWN01_16080 [Nitrosopumilaceae archaeon]|nr:hypothetical protein [Nitrosopumilaceae archaeon]NIU02356.1 hypothetical protein [Nitrosopumilaceae archaeon]NIU88813.1 hypothetical protein [Nitrosopumilaceae archaeon]NIV66938.1 hypothetical protein [Nitrosopumilaceae archaeon]NIX62957.1 hypothetical protein [Nitrosopumilaceae archaeon]